MTRGRGCIVASIITSVLWGGGCRSAPPPETPFAEAEALRSRHEEDASHLALGRYERALAGWKRRGDEGSAARAARAMGVTYEELGLLHESARALQAALALVLQSSDPILESDIRSALGAVLALVAEGDEAFARAEEQCRQALALAREHEKQDAEGAAWMCLGEVAYYRQRPEEALAAYREAAGLWEGLGDTEEGAGSLLHEGYVHSDLTRYDEARRCYDAAREGLVDPRDRAVLRVAEARLCLREGKYQEAIDGFEAALRALRPMGDAVWIGSSLTGIAKAYGELGRTDQSLEYWEEAFRMFEGTGLRNIAVDVLISLGEAQRMQSQDASARDSFGRALALAGELGIERWEAVALRELGALDLQQRKPEAAIDDLEASMVMQQSLEDPQLAARTRADLGEARLLLGEPNRAARRFEEALELSRTAGDRVTEARGLFGLARTAAQVDQLASARERVEAALSVVDSLRTATENRDLRASYLASVYHYSELQTDVLMRLHRLRPQEGLDAEAFAASERARARSLLDRLAEAGIDVRQGVDAEVLKREQRLRKEFDDWAWRQRTGADAAGSTASPSREYEELEERWGQVQAEIRSRSPRLVALAEPRPSSIREVQDVLLDDDTLLLEYALGEERSYLWAVWKEGHSSHVLPPRAEIERAARQAYDCLTARLAVEAPGRERQRQIAEADVEYWTWASELSETLLGPVAGQLAGRRILVVADGALQYLPFPALPEPGRRPPLVPLVVEHEVVSLPSASVMAALRGDSRRRPLPPGVVAVLADPVFEGDDPRMAGVPIEGGSDGERPARRGFPRLIATRHEARSILATAQEGRTLQALGFDASRATALGPELARYRIIHFATHSLFDDAHPERSGIVLSLFDARGRPRDGFLRLHDIYGLDLPVDLVVLSACDTALGRPIRGEGLVGLVRGFMHAGAKRVVASLWKVDDEATGEIMKRFYREMLREGRPPAAALRQAQLALWQQRRWQPPFYWAAFVLQGEWN